MTRVIDLNEVKLTSVNRKYILSKGRLVLSKEYRDFKKMISLCCRKKQKWNIPIRVIIRFDYASRFDIDNPCKPILDGMQDAGIISNDAIIKQLFVIKDSGYKKGRLTIDIAELF
jgi:Holliday junction resolvase RusA-like endonuclease